MNFGQTTNQKSLVLNTTYAGSIHPPLEEFLLLEDGGLFELEDGSGFLLLEDGQPETFNILLEDGFDLLQEDGADLLTEAAP